MPQQPDIRSIPDVCETQVFAGPGSDPEGPPALLIEVPHGATTRRHFDAMRRKLHGTLPDDLIQFFFVNTDVGAPECALEIARRVIDGTPREIRQPKVLVLRSLIPRTFIDCNRIVDLANPGTAGMTPGLPEYVDARLDAPTLLAMHAAYHDVASRAFDDVCGGGGVALMLHTYAPRSVKIDRFDEGIVHALRRAYEPAVFPTWPERPEVDLITETTEGGSLAPPDVVAALHRAYAAIGIESRENATYRLHPATMGHRYSARHPGRVLCVEINRALLADPFDPFREMKIGLAQTARLSAPLASVLRNGIVSDP